MALLTYTEPYFISNGNLPSAKKNKRFLLGRLILPRSSEFDHKSFLALANRNLFLSYRELFPPHN